MSDNGNPADGLHDLGIRIDDVESNGVPPGVVTELATPATDGLFTVTLDFGSTVFDGSDRWLNEQTVGSAGT